MKLNPKTALCRDLAIDRKLIRIWTERGSGRQFHITLDVSVIHRAQEVYDWLREHKEEYGLYERRESDDYLDDHLYLDIHWFNCWPEITYPIDEKAIRVRGQRQRQVEDERPFREMLLAVHLTEVQRREAGEELMNLPLDTMMALLDRLAPLPDQEYEDELLAEFHTDPTEKINWKDEGF
jgi:hypothetical protein